jgi:DNA helicase IV
MEVLNIATQLDSVYRATCARLNVDEPWFGAFALDREGTRSAYYVGTHRHPAERIIDWQHPLARAYYDHRPGVGPIAVPDHTSHLRISPSCSGSLS